MLSQFLSLFATDFAVLLEISLRGNEYDICVWVSDLAYLGDPRLNVCETVLISDGVGKDDAMSPFVERLSDVAKTLLPSSIPYIKSNLVPMKFDAFDFEIDTDSTEVVSLEGVFAVANEETGFSDAAIADN